MVDSHSLRSASVRLSRSLRRGRLPGVVLASCLLWTGVSRGQSPSDKAAADGLFEEGRKLMDQGKLAEACPKLAESQRLDPGVGTLMNLALCYEKSGKTATAWATYREAQGMAQTQGRAQQAAVAERRASALASKLSWLTVVVSDPPAGLEVKRDGVLLGSPALGVAVPVDPGRHTVVAQAPGKQPWTSTFEVAEGNAATLTIPALTPLPASAATSATTDTPTTDTPGRPTAGPSREPAPSPFLARPPAGDSGGKHGSAQRVSGMVMSGAGLVALGAFGLFALQGRSRYDDSLSRCNENNVCDAEGLRLRNDARSAGDRATVSLGVGAALLAGGLTLWLTAPKSHDSGSTVGRLGITPSLGGASLRGAF